MVITAAASADPYSSLIHAKESDVLLVMIDGRAVVGTRALMKALGAKGESIKVGAHARVIDYGAGDPRIPTVTCKEAHAGPGGCSRASADAAERTRTRAMA